MRISAAGSVVASAALLTISCTDTTSIPARALTPIRASVTNASTTRPRSHPNSEKYRDSGFHPVTGSSGSATVSARALLDKSGRTDVEVTTGTFDGGAGPGWLANVQVKAFSPSGTLAFTDNYSGSSSTASFPYTTLPHGTNLQVQNVVRGIDDPHADVVTLATAVYFRPDLIASRLDGPSSAPLGAAVNLQGYIRERNGEVGARADCVLYVDGVAADRATGIWVDAGGMVSCAMTHVFTEARDYALELRVEAVHPRDFDDSNNSVTASITAVAPSGFSTYDFQAWDATNSGWWRAVSTLTLWDGTVQTWDQTYTREGPWQNATLNGLIPRAFDYTAPIRLRGEISTNGGTVNTVDITYAPLDFVDWQEGYCGSTYDLATSVDTYICVYTAGRLAGYTYVQYGWGGAEIHYTSHSYVYYWDPSGQLHESWYSEDYMDSRPMVTMGPDVSAWVSVQGVNDAEATSAQATVQLEPVDLRWDFTDPGCSEVPVTGCWDLHDHTYGRLGWVSYGDWPPFTP